MPGPPRSRRRPAKLRLRLVAAWALLGTAACSLGGLKGFTSGEPIGGEAGAPPGPEGGAVSTADGGGADAADAGPDPYALAVLKDSPISYWRLDETSGTRCKDEMGKHDGTYDTDVTLGAPGALASGGTAALFTLESGLIAIGNAFEFPDAEPFSFESWIKPTTAPISGSIFATTIDDPDAGYAPRQGTTYFLTADGVGFERWSDHLVQFTHLMGSPLRGNAWSHLVVTFDGAMTTLYVNGTAASMNGPGSPMTKTPRPFAWGTMKGSFDELAVYDHVLTPVRVLAHFIAASAPR